MIKRIMKLLDLWESLMIQQKKVMELNAKVFELSIENQTNCKKLEVYKLKSRKYELENADLKQGENQKLEYIKEALRLLE